MHRIVHQEGEWIVKDTDSGYYVYSRYRKHEKEHTHIRTKEGYLLLLDCIRDRKVPDSDYLKGSILRICTRKEHKKLVKAVKHKIDKDKQKPKFIRVNKGLVR